MRHSVSDGDNPCISAEIFGMGNRDYRLVTMSGNVIDERFDDCFRLQIDIGSRLIGNQKAGGTACSFSRQSAGTTETDVAFYLYVIPGFI
jgi:hypothetical protein